MNKNPNFLINVTQICIIYVNCENTRPQFNLEFGAFNIAFLIRFTYSLFQVVSQSNWLPESVTPAAGKELEKLLFLGPFLAFSVFAVKNIPLYFRLLVSLIGSRNL